SPAPEVPKFSSARLCCLKNCSPSVGAWFSQLLIWPTATLNWSCACAVAAATGTISTAAQASLVRVRIIPILLSPADALAFTPRRRPSPRLRLCAFRRAGATRGQPACELKPHAPVFPGPAHHVGQGIDGAGELGLPARQRHDLAQHVSLQL